MRGQTQNATRFVDAEMKKQRELDETSLHFVHCHCLTSAGEQDEFAAGKGQLIKNS
jgi:hypothetical protein